MAQPEVVAAIVTALGAAAVGGWGVFVGRRAQLEVAREADARKHDFEEFRRQLDEQDRLRARVDRYQEPLVRAAFDLQSRLWNIVDGGFIASYGVRGSEREKAYALESTLWLFGQYYGWVEILRREAQFLQLPERDARQRVQEMLNNIAGVCASDRAFGDTIFRIFRSEQRALGELMIAPGSDADGRPRTDCLGFAELSERWQDQDSATSRWFGPLAKSIKALTTEPARVERIRALQRALLGLVDAIDPDRVRFPGGRQPLTDMAPRPR